jgi:deazaflavin-dependent oxidoreductase (nitroreductase family)
VASEADVTDWDNPLESSLGWVREHSRRYVETGGEDGHEWQGVPTLLLTTIGRRSGQPRRQALIYGQDGSNYLVVASKGGAPTNPLWYENLVAHPEVRLQVKNDRFTARARDATPEERPRLWQLMIGLWPAYDDYQAKTQRQIPVVVLEPVRDLLGQQLG